MCSAYSGSALQRPASVNGRLRSDPVFLQWNTSPLSCVCALGGEADEPRVEVSYDAITFFTHQVNGQTYGGWYRQLAPRELEVIGAGFMCKAAYAGCDELSVARSVLEDALRGQMQTGAHPQPLEGAAGGQGDNTPR